MDWRAVSAAAWANLWNTKTRGASTITMQLAGLLDEDLKRSNSGRSIVQKLGRGLQPALHRGRVGGQCQRSSRAPQPPAGLVQRMVTVEGEAPRSEWFISGTEQASFAMEKGAARAHSTSDRGPNDAKPSGNRASNTARITAPTSGTILALDPDIPPQAQRLSLEAEGSNLRWLIDGK